jgi:hypothetical protein
MPDSTSNKILSFLSPIWFLWSGAVVLNIIAFLLVIFKIRPGQQTLALHYNVLAGVEWYGNGYNLYLIPGLGFVLGVANFILFRSLKKNPEFLDFLVPFVNLCLQIILLATVLFLTKVN